jgi:large-conductance mechanosensitive channel
MNTNTSQLLSIMKIIFWIVFIGLLIQAGALLTTYTMSLFNPEVSKDLYLGLDLSALQEWSTYQYTNHISFLVGFLLIKAYIAFLVIKIFSKMDLRNPFTEAVSVQLSKISYVAVTAGLLAYIAQGHTKWLVKSGMDLSENWGSGAFLFLAGIIFIIAQIFKRGIELQTENELTI